MVLYTKSPVVEKSSVPPEEYTGYIIVPVTQENDKPVINEVLASLDRKLQLNINDLIEAERLRGKKGELLEIIRGKTTVILIGLGKDPDEETVRRAYAKGIKKVVTTAKEAYLVVDPLGDDDKKREAIVGALLGAYILEEFKKEKKRKLEKLLVDNPVQTEEAVAIAEGVYLARDLANAPPNHLYPEKLAEIVEKLLPPLGVEVEVKRFDKLVEEGFGGIVNVGKGSSMKPVLIIMRYKNADKPLTALVGKTIIFDTGGINLKPTYSLSGMKHDKAGGAAVIGALYTIAKMKLPVNLVALIPAAINAPGGESYLPSDVIRMWDGTWVEVGNTDAEGRLVLADSIAYAAEELGAETIVTAATLTGSIVAALGSLIAGLFTRDKELQDKLLHASKKSGEKLWPMPMEDDYKSLLARGAKTGEVNNVAVRWGDCIYAALLLEKFSHNKRFAHIDMAGPGIGPEGPVTPPDYWPKGAPGYGARLLYELAKQL